MNVSAQCEARCGNGAEGSLAAPACTDEKTVLFSLGGQLCGLPVFSVRDILDCFELNRVPLAPDEVAGNLNLRGRIVTAIDLRVRLGGAYCARNGAGGRRTAIVVEHEATLYALLVDQVTEVVSLPAEQRRPKPIGLPAAWMEFTNGVFRRDDGLLAVLELASLLALDDGVH